MLEIVSGSGREEEVDKELLLFKWSLLLFDDVGVV